MIVSKSCYNQRRISGTAVLVVVAILISSCYSNSAHAIQLVGEPFVLPYVVNGKLFQKQSVSVLLDETDTAAQGVPIKVGNYTLTITVKDAYYSYSETMIMKLYNETMYAVAESCEVDDPLTFYNVSTSPEKLIQSVQSRAPPAVRRLLMNGKQAGAAVALGALTVGMCALSAGAGCGFAAAMSGFGFSLMGGGGGPGWDAINNLQSQINDVAALQNKQSEWMSAADTSIKATSHAVDAVDREVKALGSALYGEHEYATSIFHLAKDNTAAIKDLQTVTDSQRRTLRTLAAKTDKQLTELYADIGVVSNQMVNMSVAMQRIQTQQSSDMVNVLYLIQNTTSGVYRSLNTTVNAWELDSKQLHRDVRQMQRSLRDTLGLLQDSRQRGALRRGLTPVVFQQLDLIAARGFRPFLRDAGQRPNRSFTYEQEHLDVAHLYLSYIASSPPPSTVPIQRNIEWIFYYSKTFLAKNMRVSNTWLDMLEDLGPAGCVTDSRNASALNKPFCNAWISEVRTWCTALTRTDNSAEPAWQYTPDLTCTRATGCGNFGMGFVDKNGTARISLLSPNTYCKGGNEADTVTTDSPSNYYTDVATFLTKSLYPLCDTYNTWSATKGLYRLFSQEMSMKVDVRWNANRPVCSVPDPSDLLDESFSTPDSFIFAFLQIMQTAYKRVAAKFQPMRDEIEGILPSDLGIVEQPFQRVRSGGLQHACAYSTIVGVKGPLVPVYTYTYMGAKANIEVRIVDDFGHNVATYEKSDVLMTPVGLQPPATWIVPGGLDLSGGYVYDVPQDNLPFTPSLASRAGKATYIRVPVSWDDSLQGAYNLEQLMQSYGETEYDPKDASESISAYHRPIVTSKSGVNTGADTDAQPALSCDLQASVTGLPVSETCAYLSAYSPEIIGRSDDTYEMNLRPRSFSILASNIIIPMGQLHIDASTGCPHAKISIVKSSQGLVRVDLTNPTAQTIVFMVATGPTLHAALTTTMAATTNGGFAYVDTLSTAARNCVKSWPWITLAAGVSWTATVDASCVVASKLSMGVEVRTVENTPAMQSATQFTSALCSLFNSTDLLVSSVKFPAIVDATPAILGDLHTAVVDVVDHTNLVTQTMMLTLANAMTRASFNYMQVQLDLALQQGFSSDQIALLYNKLNASHNTLQQYLDSQTTGLIAFSNQIGNQVVGRTNLSDAVNTDLAQADKAATDLARNVANAAADQAAADAANLAFLRSWTTFIQASDNATSAITVMWKFYTLLHNKTVEVEALQNWTNSDLNRLRKELEDMQRADSSSSGLCGWPFVSFVCGLGSTWDSWISIIVFFFEIVLLILFLYCVGKPLIAMCAKSCPRLHNVMSICINGNNGNVQYQLITNDLADISTRLAAVEKQLGQT